MVFEVRDIRIDRQQSHYYGVRVTGDLYCDGRYAITADLARLEDIIREKLKLCDHQVTQTRARTPLDYR